MRVLKYSLRRAMATKCDIIRDVGVASSCGMCEALRGAAPIPAGCLIGGRTPPAAACSVASMANSRMALFGSQYSPANLVEGAVDRAARTLVEKNYLTAIDAAEKELAIAYPQAAPGAAAVGWPDFERCLWNRDGQKGGGNGNVYFRRNDLTGPSGFGMAPTYPVGGGFAKNLIWKAGGVPSPVPLGVDYVMNPDLFAMLMFVILVVVLAALVRAAWRTAANAPYFAQQAADAERRRLEASDPYRGTPFESYPDPRAKCRAYIDAMKAQGYDVSHLEEQCGILEKVG
jgi:hypothetical protein